jgi:nucleoside-diphosphate-sugar epimerase
MKVVVTGGTGFLGRHVAWRLAGSGHDVVFTGRNSRAAAEVIENAPAPVRFVAIDHGDRDAQATLQECAKGAGAVIHCAALSSPWGSSNAFEKANVEATREVVEACRFAKVPRLVHISTPSVYFRYADCVGVREDDALPPPVNTYARTKLAAEGIVRDAGLDHAVILRPRAIFGAWDNTILPRLLRTLRGRAVPLVRDGSALVDLTCVDNVSDAVMLALEARCPPGRIYNISNGEPVRVRSLFEQVARAFGLELRTRSVRYGLADAIARGLEAISPPAWEPPLTRYTLGTITFSQTLDLTRARRELGYAPRVSFEKGLEDTARWWRTRGAPS